MTHWMTVNQWPFFANNVRGRYLFLVLNIILRTKYVLQNKQGNDYACIVWHIGIVVGMGKVLLQLKFKSILIVV